MWLNLWDFVLTPPVTCDFHFKSKIPRNSFFLILYFKTRGYPVFEILKKGWAFLHQDQAAQMGDFL